MQGVSNFWSPGRLSTWSVYSGDRPSQIFGNSDTIVNNQKSRLRCEAFKPSVGKSLFDHPGFLINSQNFNLRVDSLGVEPTPNSAGSEKGVLSAQPDIF
jgi:hypothetical protein